MKDHRILRYLSFVAGTGLLAFGLLNIHSRCGISEGGVLGLSLLIHHWFGFSPGYVCFVLDMTCFGIGTLVMGKGFLGESIFTSALYALWYQFFELTGPALPDFTAQPMLAAIIGGLFVGVGCGMIVRHDRAAGGDDALAITMNHLTGMKVSHFYFLSDSAVLLLSLSYIPFRRIGWSLFSVMISSSVIELLRPKKEE